MSRYFLPSHRRTIDEIFEEAIVVNPKIKELCVCLDAKMLGEHDSDFTVWLDDKIATLKDDLR
jgi:hypothetical protein